MTGVQTCALPIFLGLLSLCLVFLLPVALILGIVAVVKIGKDPRLSGQGLGIAAICLSVVGVFFWVICAAVALPGFLRFQAKAKQAECKLNLRTLYSAEQLYYAERAAYSPKAAEVGFSPERGNRYAYLLSLDGPLEDRSGQAASNPQTATRIGADAHRFNALDTQRMLVALPSLAGGARPGVAGACPKCDFTAACVGQIDDDGTYDVWSVSTRSRTGPDGSEIPAGQPYNDVSDVTR